MRCGYAVVSNRYCQVARIDERQWVDKLAYYHNRGNIRQGLEWVNNMGLRNAADYYRRVLSKDVMTVPKEVKQRLMNSTTGPTKYMEKIDAHY